MQQAFDERNQKVARSTISLLKEAGLDVGILGMQEGCSGDPARRAGNEYLFQMLAETNMMTFQELGVKRIIASCPHCFHTLGERVCRLRWGRSGSLPPFGNTSQIAGGREVATSREERAEHHIP